MRSGAAAEPQSRAMLGIPLAVWVGHPAAELAPVVAHLREIFVSDPATARGCRATDSACRRRPGAAMKRAGAFCARLGLRVPILLAPMAGASAPSLFQETRRNLPKKAKDLIP